jgi:DNA mismatch endonuclease (patch repair protein)
MCAARSIGPDVHSPEIRSYNMSRIRGRDTKPEMIVRRGLHHRGLRYQLHRRDLPGRPDLVFPARRCVAFIHGCFWHGHDCPMFHPPASRADFWKRKIEANRARDLSAVKALAADGWRRLTIWECALRGPAKLEQPQLLDVCESFVRGDALSCELEGRWQSL